MRAARTRSTPKWPLKRSASSDDAESTPLLTPGRSRIARDGPFLRRRPTIYRFRRPSTGSNYAHLPSPRPIFPVNNSPQPDSTPAPLLYGAPTHPSPGRPSKQGLYDPWFEHDACGVGFVADMHG